MTKAVCTKCNRKLFVDGGPRDQMPRLRELGWLLVRRQLICPECARAP